jgi:hypothetical protein
MFQTISMRTEHVGITSNRKCYRRFQLGQNVFHTGVTSDRKWSKLILVRTERVSQWNTQVQTTNV